MDAKGCRATQSAVPYVVMKICSRYCSLRGLDRRHAIGGDHQTGRRAVQTIIICGVQEASTHDVPAPSRTDLDRWCRASNLRRPVSRGKAWSPVYEALDWANRGRGKRRNAKKKELETAEKRM